MPVRSFAPLVERAHYGFVERLYVHSHISEIMDLRTSGLSLPAIANALNLREFLAINGIPRDIGSVKAVIGLDRRIRLVVALLRAERQKTDER
jgi:hypothetical protein